ncbi:hypothetical protein Tco_0635371, partial [Tanacetum coccineum]
LIKSSVENLVQIPSKSEGIPDNMCDVPFRDNSLPLDISKDQFEGFSDSNEDPEEDSEEDPEEDLEEEPEEGDDEEKEMEVDDEENNLEDDDDKAAAAEDPQPSKLRGTPHDSK